MSKSTSNIRPRATVTAAARIPKYRLHKPTNLAVVTLNGRDHYLGPYGTKESMRRYDSIVAEWMASGRRRAPLAGEAITVAELLAAFLDHAQIHYRHPDGSISRELKNMKCVIDVLRVFDELPVDEFTPQRLKAIRQMMIQRGWTRRAINRNVVRVRTIFRWGVSECLVNVATHQALGTLQGLQAGRSDAKEKPKVRAVTEREIDGVKPYLPQVIRDMIEVQYLTGMRPGELVSMRPVDLDTTDEEVWHYRPATHKTAWSGHERVIAVGPRARSIVQKYLASRPVDQPIFSPAEAMEERRRRRHDERKTPLSCGNRPGTNRKRSPKRKPGTSFTSVTYAQAVRVACQQAWPHPTLAAIPKNELTEKQVNELSVWNAAHRWTPNQLRHACATRVRKLAGLELARTVLGHSTSSVTEAFYAEADFQKAADLMRKIG